MSEQYPSLEPLPSFDSDSSGNDPVPQSDSTPSDERPSGTSEEQEAGAKQQNNVENVIAENVSFSTIESQIIQLYQTRTALRHFTCAEAKPVSTAWEDASQQSCRASDAEVDKLLDHLEEHRVLLLSAARGAGKVMAAIYLARQLRERGGCQQPTLLAQSLDRQVRIDTRHLASRDRDKEFQNRVVIIHDALTRVERTDESGWKQLTEQLRERKSYVVFTGDATDAGTLDGASRTLLARELPRHPREVLGKELDRILVRLEGRLADSPELVTSLRTQREWLLDTFAFVPQLSEFVDHYVELGVPGLDLREAWRRFNDAGGRLLRELSDDLDGWSAAFSLGLAQCLRDSHGTSWVEFDRLHRQVRQWLRRDLQARSVEGAEDETAGPAAPPDFSDARLLKLCNAEDFVDTASLASMVRFRNGITPEQMWEAMLTCHRRALMAVLPGLRAAAERTSEMRVLAAQIIGRMGEVDPSRIVVPLVDRWVRSADTRQQGSVGPLFEGVLGSGSKPYRTAALRHLKGLQSGGSGPVLKQRLPAVIAAYSWIGDYELSHAMRELGAITREHLAPMIADVQWGKRLLARVERSLDEQKSAKAEAVLLSYHTLLRGAVQQVYAEHGGTFVGIQLSLASLCSTRGPVPVLTELRKWIAEGGWKTGVVVALMFLQERGIADRLKAAKVTTGTSEDGTGAACNPLVMWMGEGDEEVRQVARFLGDLYESLSTPFVVDAQLQQYCNESMLAHLVDWVHDALPVPEHLAAMKTLFQMLARAHDGLMREPLTELLDDQAADAEDPRMRAFASSLRL